MIAYMCPSPVGPLTLEEENGALTALRFNPDLPRDAAPFALPSTPLLRQAAAELREYFAGERKIFTVPLAPKGTPFQQQVWAALREIPYGETRSYKEIAAMVGNEKACRAVGMANNRNPLPIFIPCHRVVGADGKPVGYAGGLDVKTFLLELEQE
ncbi:MAG: methylated-DNA--[Oscillospiraceae bacterium]|nr:methylated-DNA--[protein]-cysteine S-methyltransferase [Oscillospiraceae bacterium]